MSKWRPWSRRHDSESSDNQPVPFETVLGHELFALGKAPNPPNGTAKKRDPYRAALDGDLMGLAFSGGGIRSATFNLGVIQALADLRLLNRFNYLSTVSGGGYIGSWLTALIHRENKAGPQKDDDPASGIGRVEKRLRTQRRKLGSGKDPEDSAVTFLRQHSNYLTPKVGLFTADTWTVFAIYLRNVTLNLLLLIPGLAALLLVPKLIIAGTEAFPAFLQRHSIPVFWPVVVVSLLLGLWATIVMGFSLAALLTRNGSGKKNHVEIDDLPQSAIFWKVVAPLTAAAFLASRWLRHANDQWLDWVIWVTVAYFSACAVSYFWALRSQKKPVQKPLETEGPESDETAAPEDDKTAGPEVDETDYWKYHKTWWRLILTAVPVGLVGGLLLPLCGQILTEMDDRSAWIWGTPLILAWFIVLGVLHTGIMGLALRDFEREWSSRLGAWLLIVGAVWIVSFAVIVCGPVAFAGLKGWVGGVVASGWAASTLGGLLAAHRRPKNGTPSTLRSLVLAIAPYVFVAGLLTVFAAGLDMGTSYAVDRGTSWSDFQCQRQTALDKLDAFGKLEAEERKGVREPELWADLYRAHRPLFEATSQSFWTLLGLISGLTLLGTLLGRQIDINEFSMHGFYRNRLVRCYLGASQDPEERHRTKQPFIGFHQDDDIELAQLFPNPVGHEKHRDNETPIHLINTSLNLVAGEELAWQERKAAPFVLSPLYCGFDPREKKYQREKKNRVNDPEYCEFGYRRTKAEKRTTDDKKIGYGSDPVRLTLGSALAISGAAASPNMGFHSTPALAFLLTIFNVRLGWWLGNPRHPKKWKRSGPRYAMRQLFRELLGSTRARTPYVYLSDGEHFENLGVYELVRRRCRFILATDVGADPRSAFDNLGNAIRKCRADFGVEIKIDVDQLQPSGDDGFSNWHCAVGTIYYPDGAGGAERGTLLFIKSSLTGDEPRDVLSYARANPPFPHQTTADQFFDESQFESYRRLGHHVARKVLDDAVEQATDQDPGPRIILEELLLSLRQRWHSASSAIEEHFTRHAATLDRLFERQRKTPQLAFLDAQFYPEWPRFLDGAELPAGVLASQRTDLLWLPAKVEERRHGFYFCNSLIQLMENVYVDLRLDLEYDHPDNRGWMNLFKHWSWSGMFRVTWAICGATYGNRFQAFCERRLGLKPEAVKVNWLVVGKEPPLSKADFRRALEPVGSDYLNFLEREQIEIFLDYGSKKVKVHEVAQLELVVPGSGTGDAPADHLLRFGFGYVLLDQRRQVALFRIQDHLRTTGLGRRALKAVMQDPRSSMRFDPVAMSDRHKETIKRVGAPPEDASEEHAAARRRFVEEFRGAEKAFADTLRSVRREVSKDGAAGSDPAPPK